jgi:hypothetical protein
VVAKCKLIDFFRTDEKKFAVKYKLADLEQKCNEINAAYDVIKTPRGETAEMMFLRKVKRDLLMKSMSSKKGLTGKGADLSSLWKTSNTPTTKLIT